MAEKDEAIELRQLLKDKVSHRSEQYLTDLCQKMIKERMIPTNLQNVSKDALETKLSRNADFNFIEMADVITVHQAISHIGKERGSNYARQHLYLRSDRRGKTTPRKYPKPFCRKRGRPSKKRYNGFCENRRQTWQQYERKHWADHKAHKPELWAAAEQNDIETLEKLLSQCMDVDEKFEGWTPLMKASEMGNTEVMVRLLAANANVEAENKNGRTALSFACAPSHSKGVKREDQIEAVELLVSFGADPEHKDKRNNAPKDYAARWKYNDALKALEKVNPIKSER